MKVKDIIRNKRIENGLTMLDVAKAVGVSEGTVSRWESGNIENMKRDKIVSLSKILNISPSVLMGWDADIQPSNAVPYEPQSILIPKLGSVSAGLGCLADNEVIGYEPFSASSIKADEKYMCLDVHGDSMFPMLLEGDIVLVQCQTSVDSGSIAVVTVNGDEGVIKKIVYGSDWIELHSINPMYPVRRFEGKDVLKIRVMGLVTELKRKF